MAKSFLTGRAKAGALAGSWRKLVALVLIVAMMPGAVGVVAYAQPPEEPGQRAALQGLPWSDAPFTYTASGRTLDEVLGDFAHTFSLKLSLSARFPVRVSGKFDRRSPTEFLDRLASVYGFQWFVHSGTLFISRTQDAITKAIPVARLDGGGLIRRALTELRVFQDKFGYTEMPKQGVVMVSGPAAYVALVEQTIAALPVNADEMQVEVFRLMHASVDDRTVTYRDREISTPGIATVLRRLITEGVGAAPGAPVRASGTAQSSASQATDEPMRDAPANAEADARGGSRPSTVAASSLRASIQSDSRTNSIIVRDSALRMPMYRALIAKLDVPTPMVEIEALIIDVNKNKLEELGISWYASGDKGRGVVAFGNVNNAASSNSLSLFGGSSGTSVDLTTGSSVVLPNAGRYFVARVRALEQKGDASIQARPSVLTAENLGAVLDLSETFYIETRSERVALVTPVTVGTSLRVTPRLVRDGERSMVRLLVDIEDGKVQADNPVGNIPTVRRGSVSTEASLSLDESLLVGGYSSTQTITGKDKVPILGDLPLIGALFSAKNQQVQSRERLFMLRARLVAGSAPAKPVDAVPAPGAPLPPEVVKPVSALPVSVPAVVAQMTPAEPAPSPAPIVPAVASAIVVADPPPASLAAPTPAAVTDSAPTPKPVAAPNVASSVTPKVASRPSLSKLLAGGGPVNRRVAYRHLDAWTDAWSAGDMEQIMAFYSARFPERERIEARRRAALERSGAPRVAIKVIDSRLIDVDTVELEFIQWFVLSDAKLRTRKFQRWQREGNALRIIDEWSGQPKQPV